MNSVAMELAEATDPKSFPGMLKVYHGEVARALPKHLDPERMQRIALTAFRRNPKLSRCDPRSVFAAVIQSAQLGLEPDTLGRSYLVPYERNIQTNGRWESVLECQFIPGWRGLVDLVNRSGNATVFSGVIFSDQRYTFQDGSTRALIVHNETDLDDPADITHAYAVGWVKGASMPVVELWRVGKIIKHRDRYNKVGKKHYSFENWEMYARKVPLLQVLKYMPMSPELVTAITLNDAAERGHQGLTIDAAAAGDYAPPPVDGDHGQAPTPAPPPGIGQQKPLYPAVEFDANLPGWRRDIEAGKAKAADIIKIVGSRFTFTDAQKAAIEGKAPEAK